jgi:DNA polymerase-4
VVKLKFADFTRTTAERSHPEMDRGIYQDLLCEAWSRGGGRAVRLVGLGVRFADERGDGQLDLGLG